MQEKKNIINPNNIKSFENYEIEKIEKAFENLELKDTLETPSVILDILYKIYEKENIFLKQIEDLWNGIYRLSFIFPEYKLSKGEIDHISANQQNLAIMQATFALIGLWIKEWRINCFSYKIFLANLFNALERELHVTRSKLCIPGGKYFLKAKISDVIKKHNFYYIETEFLRDKNSFLHGKEICILEDRFVNPAW